MVTHTGPLLTIQDTHTASPPVGLKHIGGGPLERNDAELCQKHISLFIHCDTPQTRRQKTTAWPTAQHLEVTMETKSTAAARGRSKAQNNPPSGDQQGPPDLKTARFRFYKCNQRAPVCSVLVPP